jgi:aldose sugar dehydrogenase
MRDPNLDVQLIVGQGLSSPTSMAFVDENNILVLEKNSGNVKLVNNGVMKDDPILHLEVDNTTLTCCRGLLGIETSSKSGGSTDVFLYVTESSANGKADNEEQEIRNRVYRYQWDSQSIVNSQMMLDLPAEPGPNHPGGKLKLGLDGYLYTVIGDLNNDRMLQNFNDGPALFLEIIHFFRNMLYKRFDIEWFFQSLTYKAFFVYMTIYWKRPPTTF